MDVALTLMQALNVQQLSAFANFTRLLWQCCCQHHVASIRSLYEAMYHARKIRDASGAWDKIAVM